MNYIILNHIRQAVFFFFFSYTEVSNVLISLFVVPFSLLGKTCMIQKTVQYQSFFFSLNNCQIVLLLIFSIKIAFY